MPTFLTQSTSGQIILIVDVAVPHAPELGYQRPRALLDTGAQITLIAPSVIEQLGVASIGEGAFVPASGIAVTTEMFRLRVKVPVSDTDEEGRPIVTTSVGRDLDVMLLTYQPRGYDMILGMDLLHHYHITMYGDRCIISS